MKTQYILIVLCALSSFAGAQTIPGQQERVMALSKSKFDWLVNKQYDSLNALMDDKLQYIHSNGWVQTKQEVVDDLKSGKIKYIKVTVREALVRLYDGVAILTGLGTFEGVTEGNAFTIDLRYTEVYIKTGIRWKLASRHANRMP